MGLKSALLLAMGLGVAGISNASEFFEFSHFQIKTPFKISQEPIRANLTQHPGKELLIVGELDGVSRLAMYGFDKAKQNYQMLFNIELDKKYFAYDVSDEPEQKETLQSLYFLSSHSVSNFEYADAPKFTEKVKTSSIYINNNADYLKQADFVRDVNGDGLTDVVLTDFTSLNVYLQNSDGEFYKQSLPIEPTVEIFNGSVSYTEKPFYIEDMTFDGSQDVVLPADGELHVYQQNEQGGFADAPLKIKLNPNITALNWWDARGADGRSLDQSDFAHRTIRNLTDVDNNGIVDLVVQFTQSSGVLDKSNDYEIYLGNKSEGKLVYSQKADTAVKSDGTLAQLDFIDVDNDKRQEVMASSFDISVSQIISALLTGSVDQQVLIFSLDEQLKYKQRFQEEVQLKFSLTSGKSGAPVIELADLDGDGAKELILSEDDDRLKIFPGRKNSRMWHSTYQSLNVKLPKDGVLLSSDDLDMDGKHELLVRYSSEDGKDRQNRLLVLKVN